jgi:threonine dehydrogenase-like Zn-dependent dehydrogenase
MRALAWFGARDVRMVDASIPDITEPDDVILKVTGTTICGSDLHLCVSLFRARLHWIIALQGITVKSFSSRRAISLGMRYVAEVYP